MEPEIPFTVTAHSGCMDLPDNSIEAMRAGADAGADIVEFDLQYNAEGVPVLSHDEPVPDDCRTLEDAFAFMREYPRIKANIDVKSTAFLETVPVLAEKYGVADRIFLTGVGEDFVPAVREKCPGIVYYLNVPVFKWTNPDTLAKKIRKAGAVGANFHFSGLTPKMARMLHGHGLLVSVWTVNADRDIRRVMKCRPDNITSRRPDAVIRLAENSVANS